MSVVVSYFIIPLALLLLIVNIYFRLRIIKQFKRLSKQNIHLEPSMLLKRSQRAAYFEKQYPQHKTELMAFAKTLDKLVMIVVGGFSLILLIFLFIYFNQ